MCQFEGWTICFLFIYLFTLSLFIYLFTLSLFIYLFILSLFIYLFILSLPFWPVLIFPTVFHIVAGQENLMHLALEHEFTIKNLIECPCFFQAEPTILVKSIATIYQHENFFAGTVF